MAIKLVNHHGRALYTRKSEPRRYTHALVSVRMDLIEAVNGPGATRSTGNTGEPSYVSSSQHGAPAMLLSCSSSVERLTRKVIELDTWHHSVKGTQEATLDRLTWRLNRDDCRDTSEVIAATVRQPWMTDANYASHVEFYSEPVVRARLNEHAARLRDLVGRSYGLTVLPVVDGIVTLPLVLGRIDGTRWLRLKEAR